MKDRRRFLKRGMFLGVAMALGKMDLLKAEGGTLTVPLDQWGQVIFVRKGKKISVPVDEIFASLSVKL